MIPAHADSRDWFPLDAEAHARQLAALPRLLGEPPRRVVDLGCGDGRLLVPLAQLGYDMVGMDLNEAAITAARHALHATDCTARLVEHDVRSPWPDDLPVFDAVLCLGNTFMLFAAMDEAVALGERVAATLSPTGCFVIDDFPFAGWSELTEGYWQNGISEDGDLQMCWQPGDAVFTLRKGDNVDPMLETIGRDEPRYRLWSLGALELLGRLIGLPHLDHNTEAGLITFRRSTSA